MKEHNGVSACIVSYNSKGQLTGALDSLFHSRLDEPLKVYVVDNASPDESAKWVKAHYPEVHLIASNENLGFGKGNNGVLPFLSSRYHMLVNPDVTFAPETIQFGMAYMDQHPEIAVLTPRVLNMDGTEQFLPKKEPSIRYLLGGRLEKLGKPFATWREEYTWKNENITAPCNAKFATGCFLLIRTEIFQRMNGFDERFFMYQEDSDLSKRVQEYGTITYHPDFTVNHAWERENTKKLKGNLRQVHSIFKYFRKWGIKW